MWYVLYKEENSLKEKRRMVLSEGELELTLEELDAKGCTDIHIQEFGKKANIKIDLNHPLQRNTEQWDKNKVEQLAKELMESDEIKYED
jgi:2-iminoacetate synthase ThiH